VETLKVKGILNEVRSESRAADVQSDPRVFPVTVRCGLCNKSLMDPDQRSQRPYPDRGSTYSFWTAYFMILLREVENMRTLEIFSDYV
jgi:hypothetical protein